jgi:type VI secretion system protein ImpJ
MKQLSQVVWSEGMHHGPHQFQVQSRFFEEITQFGIPHMWFEPYGFSGLELDAAALRNGTVSVVHAPGIFKDGLAFNMPESDSLPLPRTVAEAYPPTRESLTLSLQFPRAVSVLRTARFPSTTSMGARP